MENGAGDNLINDMWGTKSRLWVMKYGSQWLWKWGKWRMDDKVWRIEYVVKYGESRLSKKVEACMGEYHGWSVWDWVWVCRIKCGIREPCLQSVGWEWKGEHGGQSIRCVQCRVCVMNCDNRLRVRKMKKRCDAWWMQQELWRIECVEGSMAYKAEYVVRITEKEGRASWVQESVWRIKYTERSIGTEYGERRMEITRDRMVKRAWVTENRVYTIKCGTWHKKE